MELFRQGDILFQKIDQYTYEKYEECKDKIVARGEQTGHHHSFSNNAQVLLLKNYNSIEPEILQVMEDGGAILTHQEHLPLKIPKGTYKIRREVEYNPFTLQLNKVRD
jgi:hypothetical protein